MRLLASALVLALFGLGSFWMWQEATGGEDTALEGVVLSDESSRVAVGPTAVVPGRSGAPTGQDVVAGVPDVVVQVWDRLALGAHESAVSSADAAERSAQDDEAATSTADKATATGSGRSGSATSGGSVSEPEPVHRTPVDPDDDDDDWDDDDDDDDDDWDDDDDDDDWDD